MLLYDRQMQSIIIPGIPSLFGTLRFYQTPTEGSLLYYLIIIVGNKNSFEEIKDVTLK